VVTIEVDLREINYDSGRWMKLTQNHVVLAVLNLGVLPPEIYSVSKVKVLVWFLCLNSTS